MTQHLRQALHDFAERADAPSASPGAAPNARDLWQRGRSARRQRVAASVVVVGAVLALLGAVVPVVGDQLRTTPVPASYDEADLAVPDDIRPPSSWGPSADENDPPGPLAVVGSAPRRGIWPFSQDQQWFGVSAVDQSATWLDLPGQSEDDRRIALSPDGSSLAYFLHGTPPGPRGEVADPSYLADGPQSDVVGFAVLDLVTGEVTERELETRFGIRSQALAWSGDSQWLLADPAQYMRMLGGSRVANIEAWRPSTGEVTTLRRLDASSAIGPSPRGVATWSGERGSLLEVDPATGEAVSHEVDWWWNDDFASAAPVVSARGSSVAWLDGRRRGKGERRGTWPAVFVAPVGADGVVGRPNAVGADWSPHGVLGWLDERNLLVEATPTPILGPEPERRILVVDVETGQSRPGVGRPASYEDLDAIAVATDLLEHPLVESQGRPLGVLRLVLAGLSLLMLGVGLRQWRNRRQERALATGGEQ